MNKVIIFVALVAVLVIAATEGKSKLSVTIYTYIY